MNRSLTHQTLKLYWQHVRRYPRYIIGDLVSTPLTVIVDNYLPPLVLASVLDRLAKGDFDPHNLWSSFGMSLLLYAIFLFIGSIGWRIVDAFHWRLEAGVQRDMAKNIYDHLLNQSADFHANHFSGSLVSQTNKLMGSYGRFADTTLYQVIQLFTGLIFTMVVLAGRAPLYVILLFIFVIIWLASASFITRKVRLLSSKQANLESRQTGYLSDSITNILAVKSFATGPYERKQFARISDTIHNSTLDVMRAHQRQMFYFGGFSRAISIAALVATIISVTIFNTDIATAFLIFTYTGSVVNSLWSFCNSSLRNYNRALGDAADMVEILQIAPEVKDPATPEIPRIHKGMVSFQDVAFTHHGANDTIFEKFSIDIRPGEKIGLVGHSGSGKTTLTRLLLRFSDIDSGKILIDDQDISHLSQDDLRRFIAYVPQEPLLFHRTIRENISYGNPEASPEEIMAFAKKANAHEFIKQLPKGYDTLVGERGVKLSGGQRQRVAIARAMLKNAPILLLDEATSALDSESEQLIQDALWKLMEGRTAIVIAHRLSTIQKMDRIIVLADGNIAEQGSHLELIHQDGVYANLWTRQSGGFLED